MFWLRICSFSLAILSVISLRAQIKPTNAEQRLQSLATKKTLTQQSLVNHIPFRNIGPTIMSGRVVDLDVNPDDPTEFYVAYATGGLWHTTNNGQSFEPVFDNEEVLFIGDIAVNWNSSTRIIWIGTGEVNSSRSSYAGTGIYKSVNNGKNWTYLGLPETHHIGKIQLHPTDVNTVWVAALGHLYSANKERGVFKTTDGGKTWKHTLAIDENTGVVDMDINPANPNELYAAAWFRTRTAGHFRESGKTSGIYKSVDGGETWNLISTPASGFVTGDSVGRIGIAVYPKNPNIVYAVVDNNFHRPDTAKKDTSKYVLKNFKDLTKEQFLALDNNKLDTFIKKNGIPKKYTAKKIKDLVEEGKLLPTVIWDYLYDANTALFETPIIGCEVYRSNDAGLSWKKVNEKELNLYNTYGYYFGKIYVSPYNPDKVIITGYDIQLSTDGGKTFKNIDKPNVHADHHACWINPKKDSHIFSGNDGGANISYDDGEHWFKANTPPVAQFYAITVDNKKPYNVYGGLQDNGTWFGPSTNEEDAEWQQGGRYAYTELGGGDGMQVQVDSRDNATVYLGSQFGYYSRMQIVNGNPTKRNGIRPSNDLGEAEYRFNWQTPIWLSRHNEDILYMGTNRFHRSMNKGDSLPPISADLTTNPPQGNVPFGTITTIAESPLRFGLIYTGTDDGNMHVSKDGGYSFTSIQHKSLPKGLYISRIVASAHKEGRVYVTMNGYRNDHFMPYVFVSDDYGTNWKGIAANLPAEPVNVIREDPKHDSVLYVGTDGGVYVSIDKGNNWFAWNKNLPKSVPVHDIAIQQQANEIVLGTHGRSIYIAKLDSVQLLMSNYAYKIDQLKKAGRFDAFLNEPKRKKGEMKKEGADINCPPVKL